MRIRLNFFNFVMFLAIAASAMAQQMTPFMPHGNYSLGQVEGSARINSSAWQNSLPVLGESSVEGFFAGAVLLPDPPPGHKIHTAYITPSGIGWFYRGLYRGEHFYGRNRAAVSSVCGNATEVDWLTAPPIVEEQLTPAPPPTAYSAPPSYLQPQTWQGNVSGRVDVVHSGEVDYRSRPVYNDEDDRYVRRERRSRREGGAGVYFPSFGQEFAREGMRFGFRVVGDELQAQSWRHRLGRWGTVVNQTTQFVQPPPPPPCRYWCPTRGWLPCGVSCGSPVDPPPGQQPGTGYPADPGQ